MKKSPNIGSFVWVVRYLDDELGTSNVKKIKVKKVFYANGEIDPRTALADFFGVADAKGRTYPWDDVFDTEAHAKSRAATNIRAAIRYTEKRLRDTDRTLRTLNSRLRKML